MRRTTILGLVIAASSIVGCMDKLETGYKPRPLSASEADRRAYYAPAFTPEAKGGDDRRVLVGPDIGAPGVGGD